MSDRVCPIDGGSVHQHPSAPDLLVCSSCAETLTDGETVRRANRWTRRRYLDRTSK